MMSTANKKMNNINSAANLYSWQLSLLESSYPEHSFSLCCYPQHLLIQNFW
jgi:hypothetical protein